MVRVLQSHHDDVGPEAREGVPAVPEGTGMSIRSEDSLLKYQTDASNDKGKVPTPPEGTTPELSAKV